MREFTQEEIEKTSTVVKLKLPFSYPGLPEVFTSKFPDGTTLAVNRVQRPEAARRQVLGVVTPAGHWTEILGDRWGTLAFSTATLRFPRFLSLPGGIEEVFQGGPEGLMKGELYRPLLSQACALLNKLSRSLAALTDYDAIPDLVPTDFWSFEAWHDLAGSVYNRISPFGLQRTQFGTPNHLNKTELRALSDYLTRQTDELTLSMDLLTDARRALSLERYMAVLADGAAAVELANRWFIAVRRAAAVRPSPSAWEAGGYASEGAQYRQMRALLRVLDPQEAPTKSTMKKLAAFIEQRNQAFHEGRRSFHRDDLRIGLQAIDSVFSRLRAVSRNDD